MLVELLSLALMASGVLCVLGAVLSPWLTMSTELLPSERFTLSLWAACVVQDPGPSECRPYDGLLDLPTPVQIARGPTCAALAVGPLALLLAVLGLARHHRGLKVGGATFSLVAGVLVLVPASLTAHLVVQRFFDPNIPDLLPRWEFGDALFCAWTAAILHISATLLLMIHFLQRRAQEPPQQKTEPGTGTGLKGNRNQGNQGNQGTRI